MSSSSVDVGAIIQGGTGIAQIIAGYLATEEGADKLRENWKTRPTYEIPQSMQEQLNLLRERSGQGLPGEELIAGQIQGQTAQGVATSREAATSAADLMGATTSLYGNQTKAMTDLQIASARQQAANELQYAQGLGNMAQFEDKRWTWNESLKWQTRRNELQGIQQSNYDMFIGGINTLSSSGANFAGGGSSPETSSDSFAGGGNNQNQYLQYQPTFDTSQTYGEQQGTEIDLSGYDNPYASFWE